MIVRNPYTGAFHEVPDHQLYEVGGQVFDGFGNPLGSFWSDAWNKVKGVVAPAVTSFVNPAGLVGTLAPMAAGLVGSLAPGRAPPPAPAPQVRALPPPGAMAAPPQPYGSMYPAGLPGAPAMYPPPHTPWPPGWEQAQQHHTGLGPRRWYMRCATWPGPAGLVPSHAGAMAPPAVNVVQQQGPPYMPAPMARVQHRRGHRRR